jgi:hypothetical protein
MAVFDNETVYGSNVDFTGNATVSPQITTNGQLLIGSTATPNIQVGNLTSTGGTITIGYSSPNITLATGGSIATTYTTDSGSATPSSGILQIKGQNTPNTSGIRLTASGSQIDAAMFSPFSGSFTFTGTVTGGTGLTATTGNVTATAGNMVITAGNLNMPATNSGGTQGIINFGNSAMLSNFGTASTFLGVGSGNATNTGSFNTGIGFNAIPAITTGQANTCVGRIAGGGAFTTCNFNTAMGSAALFNCSNDYNTAIGANSCFCSVGLTGQGNSFVGYATGFRLTSAVFNSGIGYQVFSNLTTGDYNIGIGPDAGTNYNGAESSNILIQNAGTNGESNTLRIGTAGTGNKQVSTCYIAGINGVTVTGNAVLCSTDGQLGTISSSIRYKENVKDLDSETSIMNLRPVSFNYKTDQEKNKVYGLIAEEVEQIFPDLCLYSETGSLESIKYHEMTALLLKEIQRLNNRLCKLEHILL